jgi:hypothetical protein
MEGSLPLKGDEHEPKKQVRNIRRKTMNPLSYEKWSCEKVRLLSKHLSQEVSGPWSFLGEILEKKNNQENFYWVSILTFPYKGSRVFLPGAPLTSASDRNRLMQIG